MLKHFRQHCIKMREQIQDSLALMAKAVETRATELLSDTSSNNDDEAICPSEEDSEAPMPVETMNVDRPATVKTLPPEIHRELLSHLSPGEGVLLSLTCKDLWARRDVGGSGCIRRLRRETPWPERLVFLRLWEKDLPEFMLCYGCGKFEKRPQLKRKVPLEDLFSSNGGCRQAEGNVSVDYLGETFHIHRWILELIIRASILGSNFGLPTSIMSRQWSRMAYGVSTLKLNIGLEVRIVQAPSKDNHLFARSRHQVELDLYKDFKDQIKAANIHSCNHSTYRRDPHAVAINALKSFKETDGLTIESEIFRCEQCPTDMQVDIKRDNNRCVFATMNITAWRDLGPRGLYKNEIWSSQMGGARSMFAKFDRNDYVFGTESLKDVWSTGREST